MTHNLRTRSLNELIDEYGLEWFRQRRAKHERNFLASLTWTEAQRQAYRKRVEGIHDRLSKLNHKQLDRQKPHI